MNVRIVDPVAGQIVVPPFDVYFHVDDEAVTFTVRLDFSSGASKNSASVAVGPKCRRAHFDQAAMVTDANARLFYSSNITGIALPAPDQININLTPSIQAVAAVADGTGQVTITSPAANGTVSGAFSVYGTVSAGDSNLRGWVQSPAKPPTIYPGTLVQEAGGTYQINFAALPAGSYTLKVAADFGAAPVTTVTASESITAS
jgi:hypothetical protein